MRLSLIRSNEITPEVTVEGAEYTFWSFPPNFAEKVSTFQTYGCPVKIRLSSDSK